MSQGRDQSSWRTPLARVLGRGASGDGTGEWLAQRVTALALVPLGLWFVASAATLFGADYAQASQWLARPLNAVLLLLFLLAAMHHARLGLRIVAEDYIHTVGTKFLVLLAIAFATYGLTAAAAFALLRVALGAAG